jgi:MBG domain
VLLEPLATAPASIVSIAIAPASSTTGAGVTYTCTASLSNGKTTSCSSPAFTSSNTAVASVSGNVVTAKAAGSAQITATVGGSPSPPPAAALLTVTAAATPATLTLFGLTHTYSGNPQGAVVTTVPSGHSYSITYAGSTTAGSYPVVAEITNPSYSAPAATGTLVISQAVPTMTWTPSTHEVSRGSSLGAGVLDAISTAAGSFSYTASLHGVAAVAVNKSTILAPGAYSLTCVFAPTDSVDFSSTSKAVSFTVEEHTVVPR